jgi:chaperonin GroEL (HSP60 family)
MKLQEFEATKVVLSVLGERGILKSEEELAIILKKRLTKKEMKAINAYTIGADKSETAEAMSVDEERLAGLVASAVKKIKNESVHREFYLVKSQS